MMEPLTLLRLSPDREALARWAADRRLAHPGTDSGYVWHAALKAALGELAPQPFVDRFAVQSNEVLGYVSATPKALFDRSRDRKADQLTSAAIGLDRVRANDLPTTWRPGRQLSFEVRARPIVRSRRNARSGTVDEIDVACFRAAKEPDVPREQAYAEWLATQVARDGAAEMLDASLHAFCRTTVLRRIGGPNGRRSVRVEGPDAWLRGRLLVKDSIAFDRLLRRGIGRHRAFGFGCLLVAPAGVLE